MDDRMFRPLVWMDYWLAIVFTVLLPLIITVWAIIKRSEAINRLTIVYWRVASLLMITIYLMIPSWEISFATGFAARILIPLSLWFWVDLNEEIDDRPPDALKLVTTAWRWAISIYCAIGLVALVPFLPCAFSLNDACKVWFEAPWLYKQFIHRNTTVGFLGFLGASGLCVYVVYLGYFLLIRLWKQGRSAMER